ncbi:MAG: glycine zipper 2TM domain-containing protein [Alphaproteobacteria bacterium]|nr:glycine zipper 2TM domain-containing protein [Alphaproteobacteria bacterium]
MKKRLITMAAAAMALAACTTTGNVERNAAGGAAIGALAGAAIGNNVGDGDAGDGAAVGAAVGAAAGAARGYSQDQRLQECRNVARQPQYRDDRTGAYFYYVPGTTRSCWTDGTPRA